MDAEAQMQALVQHYEQMARNPAFVDQARHSVTWLMREFPEVFGELGQLVKERLDAPSRQG